MLILKPTLVLSRTTTLSKDHKPDKCSRFFTKTRLYVEDEIKSVVLRMPTNNQMSNIRKRKGKRSSNGVQISDAFKTFAMASADDICILTKSVESASTLFNILKQRLCELDMCLNPGKTQAIHINKGLDVTDGLQ